jgi:TonB family protein
VLPAWPSSPLLVQAAMARLLGRPDLTATAPEGVKLSLLEPATIIENSDAKVPRSLRHQLLQAEVLVSFVVDEQGQVIDPRIVESVPELDKVVLKAVKRLRFLPARRDGEVCPIHLALRYFIDQKW